MYTIKINETNVHKVDLQKSTNGTIEGTLDNLLFSSEIIKVREGVFHIIKDYKSYTVEIVKQIPEEKKLTVKINNTSYNLSIKDKYDELLHNLGLDTLASKKVNDIKAPMPGMVFKILVEEGQDIKKGDPLIILEAMKMENVLKTGIAVEKNQILIHF